MKWILLAVSAISLCSVSGYRIFPLRIYPERPDEAREVTITESVAVKHASDQRKFSVGAAVRVIPPDNGPSQGVASEGSATADGITNPVFPESDLVTENYFTTNSVTTTENPTINIVSSQNVVSPNDFLTKNVGPENYHPDNVVPSQRVDAEGRATAEGVTNAVATERDLVTENHVTTNNITTTENSIINIVSSQNVVSPNDFLAKNIHPENNPTDNVAPSQRVASEGSATADGFTNAVATERDLATKNHVTTNNITTTENPTINIVSSHNVVSPNDFLTKNVGPEYVVTENSILTGNIVTKSEIAAESEATTESIDVTKINAEATDNIATTNSPVDIDTDVVKEASPNYVNTKKVFGSENVISKSDVVTKTIGTTGNATQIEKIDAVGSVTIVKQNEKIEHINDTKSIDWPKLLLLRSEATTESVDVTINAVAKDNITTTKSTVETDTVVTTELTTAESTKEQFDLSQNVYPTESVDLKTNAPAKETYTTENIISSERTPTENGLLLKTKDVTIPQTDSSSIPDHAAEKIIKSTQKSDDTEIIVGNVVSIVDNIFLADSSIETVDTTESTKKLFTANSVGVSPKTVPSENSPTQNNISSKNVDTAGAPLKVNIDFTTKETVSPKSYESFGIFTFLVPPKTEFPKNEPDPRYDY